MDADDGGGSFWNTFHGPATGADKLTPLEQLLLSPDCSIEAVLDDEEVIQEFKSGNEKLLSRMRQVDACLQLVEYITHDPPPNASHARCYRYPFIAVELMTCNSEFFSPFVDPENTQLLDALWAFLEAAPAGQPAEGTEVLAGYFSRAVAGLLNRYMTEVVEYLRKRGVSSLLKSFLDRMYSRSLAELFARLLCQEHQSEMIFPIEGLVMQMLSCLQDSAPMSATQENIKLVIVEIISQSDSFCCGQELLVQLTSPQAIRLLVDQVFSGRADSVAAAASILSQIVWNSYVVNKGPNASPSPATLSPMSPPLLNLNMADDDLVNTGMEDPLDDLDNEAAHARASASSSSPPCSPAVHPSTPGAAPPALMVEVCLYFPRIRSLLDAVLERGPDIVALPIGNVPGIGGTTLEVINLLAMLVRTGSDEIYEALLKEQLLPRCLEIFFRHPWSSLLHNQIRGMLTEVLSTTDGVRQGAPDLVLRLLGEGGLAQRMVNEYREDQQYSQGARKKHPRVGYMGHLHEICRELITFGKNVEEVSTALGDVTGWSDIVLPFLANIDRVHSEKLGGGIPDGTAGLASSGIVNGRGYLSDASGGVQSATEDEFMLDDLTFDAVGETDNAARPWPSDTFGAEFDPDSPGSSPKSDSTASPPSPASPTLSTWTRDYSFGDEAGGATGSEAFTADFSQAQTFNADFSQAQTFDADFSQAQTFSADFSDFAPTFDANFSQDADQFSNKAGPGAEATRQDTSSLNQNVATFDSAFAPIPAAAPEPPTTRRKQSAESRPSQEESCLKQEDLLNVLGGNLGTEKREDGSWSGNSWTTTARDPFMAAVPSTCAPTSNIGTSSSLEDLSWNAFDASVSAPPFGQSVQPSAGAWPDQPVRVASAPAVCGTWPGDPAPGQPMMRVSSSPGVGTENLFALLGESAQPPAPSPIFPPNPAFASPLPAGTPWPAAEGSIGPSVGPQPWAADFGNSTSSAGGGASIVDPFSPFGSPAIPASSPGTPGSDRSWVADFDPLLQSSAGQASTATPLAGVWAPDRNGPSAQKSDLTNLDIFT